MNYFYKYLIIFFALFSVNIINTIYLFLFNINRDLSYINSFIFWILFSVFESLLILLLHIIIFKFISKSEIRNINLFILVFIISSIFLIFWEISYNNNWFLNFVFNYDIIIKIISYTVWFLLYWIYLKNKLKK